MPNPDCPACHGTGVIRTYDHIGLVDEFACDLCNPDDDMSLEPRCHHGNIRSAEPCRDCDERDALRARIDELSRVYTVQGLAIEELTAERDEARARVAELEGLLERVTEQLVARLGTNSSEWATVREVRQTLKR